MVKDRIEKLGKHFRGLWVSTTMEPDGTITKGWAVTLVKDGEYIDSDYYNSPEEALDRAIEISEMKEIKWKD